MFFAFMAEAQGPCYKQGQTPSLAIPVCGTTAFVQDSVSICDGLPIPVPCFDLITYADKNPFWYKFHCFQTGQLGFLVVPNNPGDDYDWMLFDVTGKNPNLVYSDTSCIVAYNWSGMAGNTGTSPTSVDSNSCASATVNGTPNQTKMPTLIVGHDYLLMVSHYTDTQVGYQITFGGGDAVITDSLAPFMKYARAICDGTNMLLVTNKKMRCTSLDLNGSCFALSPPNAKIISAVGNCYGGFDFDTVHVTLNTPLVPGRYNLVVNMGNDGNTLEDICYNDIPVGSKIPVDVYPMSPTPMDSFMMSDSCNPSSITLLFRRPIMCNTIAPDASDFTISGPSAVSIANVALNCNTDSATWSITLNFTQQITVGGNYTITLVTGSDGNTIIDECNFQSFTNQSLVFKAAAPQVTPIIGPSSICVNTVDTLKDATVGGTWISSKSTALSIDRFGVIHALAPDTVTINYTAIGLNGCPGYQVHPIIIHPAPKVASIQGGKNICMQNRDTLAVSSVGGSWLSSDTTIVKIDPATGIATPVNVGSATIKYQIVNQFGCSDSGTVVLSVHPLPIVAPIIGATDICINNSALYTDNTTKGIWQSDDTAVAIIDYSGIVYTKTAGNLTIKYIVVSKQGCTDSVSKNIVVHSLPVIPAINSSSDVCIGKNISFSNPLSGGQWVSANASIATINNAGLLTAVAVGRDTIRYIVTTNSCTDSVYKLIVVRPLPVVDSIMGNVPTCVNDSLQLSSIPMGGIWTSIPASIAAVNNNGLVKTLTAGYSKITYVVTSTFGCLDSVFSMLQVKAAPIPDFSIPTNICLPDGIGYFTNLTTPLLATNSYVWDFGDANNLVKVFTTNAAHQFVQPLQNSGYTIKLLAINADNCKASTTKFLPFSYIHAQPTSAISTVPSPPEVCVGNPVQFFDNSGNVLKSIWYFGNELIDTAFSEMYTYPFASTFWVTHKIIDFNGCISTPSQIMVKVDSFPIVDAGPDQYVYLGSSVMLNPLFIADSARVQWTPDIYLDNNTIANPACTPLHDTTYTLSVWNKGGCSSTDTVRVMVLDNVKIPNAFSPNADQNHDNWLIPALTKYPDCSVIVFNRYGQKVFESLHGYTHPWDGKFNGTKVPVGVYYYVIKRDDKLPVLSGPVSVFW